MTVKINNLTWKVLFVTRGSIDGSLGLTSFRNLEISIATDTVIDVVRTTITHEIVHALLESYGIVEADGKLFSEEQVADYIAMNLNTINELTATIYLEYKKRYNIK